MFNFFKKKPKDKNWDFNTQESYEALYRYMKEDLQFAKHKCPLCRKKNSQQYFIIPPGGHEFETRIRIKLSDVDYEKALSVSVMMLECKTCHNIIIIRDSLMKKACKKYLEGYFNE